MSSDDRFFSPQPNVPGQGIVASYGVAFWCLVVGIGVVAGLGGAGFMLLLRSLEHLLWSYHSGTFLDGVRAVSPAHRVLVVTGAGLLAGAGGLLLTRLRSSGGGEVSEAVWLEDGRLALVPSTARGALSIAIVAMGASLGREAAPQLFGAAAASRLCQRAGVPRWQRQMLVACGAGAGMAAVYNIPLGGALFALEVLLGTVTLPLVLPALVTSGIATAVAWIYLPRSPTYTIPVFGVAAREIVWALVVGPLAGLAAVAWVRLIARANQLRPRARARLFVPILVFAALGAVSVQYPALLGNGKNVVQLADVGALSFGLLAVLTVLKPLFTAACLGSGAPGGLFTPTLAFGVLFGGTLGHVWSLVWPGTPAGSYAVVGGAAVLAASMQGPLAASVMIIELAHGSITLMVPVLLAVTGATVVSRLIGAPSIYSARLGEREQVRRRHRDSGEPGRPDLDGVVEQEAIRAADSQRTQRR
jgi:chloride channel protein, CIC family